MFIDVFVSTVRSGQLRSLLYIMGSDSEGSVASDESPFLVQLFYRTGSLHRPEEFSGRLPSPSTSIYTWGSCTLADLALDLADAIPSALPFPSLGTRLVFQLIYPEAKDSSSHRNGPPNFVAKDLGSIVIGEGRRTGHDGDDDDDLAQDSDLDTDSTKTLDDARFMIGDYISCGILPPLSDGSVARSEGAHWRDHIPSSRQSRTVRGRRPQRDNHGNMESSEWPGRGNRAIGPGRMQRGGEHSNFPGSHSHRPGGRNRW